MRSNKEHENEPSQEVFQEVKIYSFVEGVVRGKSWTPHILSDAWESTKCEILTDNPLHAVIAQTKLTEKFIEDEKGTDPILPRTLAKKPLEVECRKFYLWSANIEAYGHMGSCPGQRVCMLCREKRQKTRKDEFRGRVGRIIQNLGRRSQDGNIQGQNRLEKASPREKKSSSEERYR